MLDLVILLSMALALTTVLALLLAGFVWAPWFIGLLLVGLLIALSRISDSAGQTTLQPESLPDDHEAVPPAVKLEDHTVNPVLTYRGAHPAPHSEGPATPVAEPVLTYRGAKSQLHEVIPQALIAKWQGKYRGNPLRRPEGSDPS